MAVQKEIWQNHIEGNLFKGNEFLRYATNADQYVLQGKVVHIPQAGALPNVEVNRAVLPATVVQRTDVDVTYALDEYTTDPILIPNADQVELSYDKRANVLQEHEATLRQRTADTILIKWAPATAASIIRTTGAATLAHLDGATGNRKKFGTADLKRAQLVLNKQDVPLENRYALVSADMFQQLTDDMTQTQYRDFSAMYDAKNGVLGMLFGFKIMMRSTVLSFDNAATPVVKPYGAAAAATDNDGVLCWQMNAVESALGEIKMFDQLSAPQYYGDIYSFLVRMGGRKRRQDGKGVVSIVQDASA